MAHAEAFLSLFVTDALHVKWVGKTVEFYEVLHQHESLRGNLKGPTLKAKGKHPEVELVRRATGKVTAIDMYHITIDGVRHSMADNALLKIVEGKQHDRWANGWRKNERHAHARARVTPYT